MFNRRSFFGAIGGMIGAVGMPFETSAREVRHNWKWPQKVFHNHARSLDLALQGRGVDVLPAYDGTGDGVRIGMPAPDGWMWKQFHVDWVDGEFEDRYISALADKIAHTAKIIRFGKLLVPRFPLSPDGISVFRGPHRVIGATNYHSGDVLVRLLKERAPVVVSDGLSVEKIIVRLDALFCVA